MIDCTSHWYPCIMTVNLCRLHPYYRTRAKLAVSSSTYSNKISCNNVMCRFNMIGKCSDKNCKWYVYAICVVYMPNMCTR